MDRRFALPCIAVVIILLSTVGGWAQAPPANPEVDSLVGSLAQREAAVTSFSGTIREMRRHLFSSRDLFHSWAREGRTMISSRTDDRGMRDCLLLQEGLISSSCAHVAGLVAPMVRSGYYPTQHQISLLHPYETQFGLWHDDCTVSQFARGPGCSARVRQLPAEGLLPVVGLEVEQQVDFERLGAQKVCTLFKIRPDWGHAVVEVECTLSAFPDRVFRSNKLSDFVEVQPGLWLATKADYTYVDPEEKAFNIGAEGFTVEAWARDLVVNQDLPDTTFSLPAER